MRSPAISIINLLLVKTASMLMSIFMIKLAKINSKTIKIAFIEDYLLLAIVQLLTIQVSLSSEQLNNIEILRCMVIGINKA